MCRVGPCADPSSHGEEGEALDGARGQPRGTGKLPHRVMPDVGSRVTDSTTSRRGVLVGIAGMAATTAGCADDSVPGTRSADAASSGLPSNAERTAKGEETTTAVAPANAAEVALPAPNNNSTSQAPVTRMIRLAASGVTQPFFADDNDRILFYDQPAPGQGGMFVIGPQEVEPRRERAEWGYMLGGSRLLVTPRVQRRDTAVTHLPTGREWSLPTTTTPVFSSDATAVAYTASGVGSPGGPSTGAGSSGWSNSAFGLTQVMIARADGEDGRKIRLPINGSVQAWIPAPDDGGNVRLLLSGRRTEPDDPSYWAYDTRDESIIELARGKRLTGLVASPDGTWIAHVSMWNRKGDQDGLWVTRTDGSRRRRIAMIGGYRWTSDNRLLVIPHRVSRSASHEVWEVSPETGNVRRLTDPSTTPFQIANFDWDISHDGSKLVYVSATDKSLWRIELGGTGTVEAVPAPPPAPSEATGDKPYRLPFAGPPGPSTWYVAQWYGVTTAGYRGRNSTYVQGQGIHFGIDFATECGSEVVAIAPGKVIAVDGDFGSPPHNCVLLLDDGNIAMYGHLVERTRHVRVGDRVEPGQVVGNTGDSIAPYTCNRNPHLHLEIRKQGRAIATNPVPYFDANWDDMTLGVWPGARFERNLDDPASNQFLDDQPDIRFGGPIITNFARPWPP
jgi:murein DD-endopeptidase MepM/ murein hydrolase activator NlpD